MTTNQEARHQDLRDSTSTARGMTADWHALWDGASVADGTFNERLLAWINAELGTSYTNLPGAMHAYAADGGFANWHSINAITTSSGPTYAVNSNEPATVADFAGVNNSGTEYYRVGGTETTFASMFTHARSSNATMVDSDGLLKWAPHNYLLQSNTFNVTWSAAFGTVTDNGDGSWNYSNDGTSTRFIGQSVTVAGTKAILAIEAKPGTQNWIAIRTVGWASDDYHWFNVSAGATGAAGTYAKTISATSDGFYLCAIEIDDVATDNAGAMNIYVGSADETIAGGTINIRNARAYRSDLGGMVNNPDRGDSYVSTTSAARYLPRRNHYRYNGSSYVKKGVLLESAAATNLITYSGDFSNAVWTNLQTTETSASVTLPDGTTGGWELDEGADNNRHTIYAILASPSAGVYTTSFVVKNNDAQFIQVQHADSTNKHGAIFDLVNGTVTDTETTAGAPAVATQNIENLGGGWYRCSVTVTYGSGTLYPNLSLSDSGTPAYDVNGNPTYTGTNRSVYLYCAQCEIGSVPTSYIPTSGSTATRAAETLTIAGSNMAASTTAMSFQMQGEMSYADNGISAGADGSAGELVFWKWLASTSNFIETVFATVGGLTGTVVWAQKASGTRDPILSSAEYSPGVNVAFNVASRHTSGAINGAKDGTASTADTTPTALPDLSATTLQMVPASSASGASDFKGTIARFRQAGVDWTDAGIEEATS